MPIEAVLDKISAQAPDVLGAVVSHKGQVYDNLKEPYDMIDIKTIMDNLLDAYDLAGALEDEGLDFGDLILGFEQHSMIARKIDGGVLLVLTRQMRRQQLLKLQVGLGIYARALARAFEEGPVDAMSPDTVVSKTAPAPAAAAPEPEAPKKKVRYYRGVAYYD